MSGTDRLIIVSMTLVVVVSVGLASVLLRGPMPTEALESANVQRADLQLTYNPDVTENMPADMALLYASLGSFRGLAINYLWMRATELKEAGKFYEAMELSRMITKLNPRFTEVWVFHSWNMAFNISVATHTERERWMWVRAGLELLRDEGIPANPKATGLYRQLAWTYMFKVGGFTDDMHWYYKRQLARHWHELLGAPPAGDAALTLAWFEPIAGMDRQFFGTDALPQQVHQALAELVAEYDQTELEQPIENLRYVTPEQFDRRITDLLAEVDDRRAELIEQLQRLKAINREQMARGVRDPDERFAERYPDAAERVAWLRELGFALNGELMHRLGTLMIEPPEPPEVAEVPEGAEHQALNVDAQLTAWLQDTDTDVARVRDELILPYLRAKTLRRDENMSASLMYELMQGDWLARPEAAGAAALPLDWRHPAALGLYWSVLGVRAGQTQINKTDRDYNQLLNTDRQVMHAIQAMTHNGYIVFNPVTMYYEQLPDPRYIDAYERAFYGASERIGGKYEISSVIESFAAGHENFLVWAARLSYFWGSREQAERLYAKLGRMYGDKFGRADKYSMPLEEFAIAELKQEITSPDDARQIIGGLVQQAIMQGYLNSRPDVARRRLATARRLHDYYQSEQGYKTLNATKDRMAMPPFGDVVANVFEVYMLLDPSRMLLEAKATVWQGIGEDNPNLQRRIWDRVRDRLYQQVRRARPDGPAPEVLFPEPPGMAEYRQAKPPIVQPE